MALKSKKTSGDAEQSYNMTKGKTTEKCDSVLLAATSTTLMFFRGHAWKDTLILTGMGIIFTDVHLSLFWVY